MWRSFLLVPRHACACACPRPRLDTSDPLLGAQRRRNTERPLSPVYSARLKRCRAEFLQVLLCIAVATLPTAFGPSRYRYRMAVLDMRDVPDER
ncbi:hypothetical protein P7K49_040819 [Saguinus oedipus]|uniref:Uncharacterized protein n=1 Tax=Saguinus oedipus TaxID=9490 RepID=A0ABQ9TCP2_SAGOE|nr:hypothetical protein P7K49_040819 [Saguinus oedipus]